MRGHPACFAALLGTLVSVSNANAEGPKDSIALNPLEPTPAGDSFFSVPSPFIGGHLVPRGQVVIDHADRPLTLSSGSTEGAIVGSQTFLHVGASLALWERLLVSLQMPIAVSQGGDSPRVRNVVFDSPSGAQAGDLRMGARVRLLGGERDRAQLGVGVYFHIPTGAASSYVSDPSVRLKPHLLLGGQRSAFVWSLSLGADIHGGGSPSAVTGGLGLGLLLLEERIQLNLETFASTQFQEGTFQITEQRTIPRDLLSTNAELLAGGRVRVFEGFVAGVEAGPGLTTALGTPTFRLMGSLAWSPRSSKKAADEVSPDPDGDGILGAADVCPYGSGVKSSIPARNGCSRHDKDADGIDDEDDACQDEPGKPSDVAKKNGCPPDRDDDGMPDGVDNCPDEAGVADMNGCAADADRDGIPDSQDACQEEPGPKSDDAAKSGCPSGSASRKPGSDSDGDGEPNAVDSCPQEKGPASTDTSANGCPKLVRVKGDELVLLSPITFGISKSDPAPLAASAAAVLQEVADVITQHPEFLKIEVQAHTDNTDKPPLSERISIARAEKVMAWLAEHGVAAERLVAKGYGGTKPIGSNSTPNGRAQNKRIQIVVLETKK